jgi:zinc protease
MQKQYFPELLNGSAYSYRLPIGKDSILSTFKASSLINFYKTWYRPNLMAVVVVGDMDPAEIEKKIIRHFGSYKNPSKLVARPAIIPISERNSNKALILTDKEQPYNILQIYNYVEKAKPVKTWGDYRTSVVEGLFNQMVSQRLSEISQQPNAPFLAAGATFSNFVRGYNSFTSYAVLGDKPAQPAIRALESITESIKKFGFLPAELERAKVSLLNNAERANKDKDKTLSDRIVGSYVSNFLSGNPILGIENRYQYLTSELAKITVEEINALAKRTENKQGFFALLMGAEKSKSSLPVADSLIYYVTAARAIPALPYQEKVLAKTLIDRVPAAGKIVQETKDAALGTTNLTLSNGITVTLKPTDFKNDEIQMDSWRWGGHHVYPIADKMNAEKAATLVQSMGVKDFSPTDLRKFLAGKTVQVTPYISADDEGIEGRSSVKDLETFFQLVHIYFTQPRKDAALFQNYVSSQKSIMENMKSIPQAYFGDTLSKVVYNNHPYTPIMETAASFDQLNLDRAMAIYKEVFSNADGLHFTFVGNIDFEKIKQYITTYLGSLPGSPAKHNYKDVGLRPAKGPLNIDVKKGAEKQSLVLMQYSGEMAYNKETDLQLAMLSEVMNIKIIEKLREEMGGIYGGGMRGGLSKRPYEQYDISVSFPCGPENVDKLVAAFLGIVKDVSDKGIDEKDMAKVKETLKKQYEVQIKNNDYWLNSLSKSFIDQTDPSWILAYPGKVEGVTGAQLQQLCKKLMDTPNYIKAVLYPEK